MSKKVFISSTCFDLKDVRAEVANALREWGYLPLWSESPDFPRASGCHSHDTCLTAVKKTDIYLLIINKRYGETYAGSAYPKEDISITWYEAKIALQEGKEIYTFVRDEVWNERFTYANNRSRAIIEPYHVDNPRVFDFIDFIDNQPINNCIEQFKDSVELKEKLETILYMPSSKKVHHISYISKITQPEPNFVGCTKFLKAITEWYEDPNVRIGALIGWGGVGKSTIVRKWYDSLDANNIKPTGIFWWNFYKDKNLDNFLNKLLSYLAQDKINLKEFRNSWAKVDKINELIHEAEYLIILDGFEEMQKGEDRGTEFGCMQHRELAEIFTNLADSKANGLCLITTRYPLKDIERWEGSSYKRESIIDLEMEDAKALLRKRNVNGDEEEFEKVIKKYKGHALALTSLAGYLNRYYKGDITKSPDIPFIYQDSKRWKDVNKLLRKYSEKMSDAEIAFLQIFSLFRTEVTEKDFIGVFKKPMHGTRFNKALINMSKHDFIDLVQGLAEWRILSYNESSEAYTTHPLVKGYFEHVFEGREKKLCHKTIYKYIGSYAPEMADTLEEMQPLFEQIYHGCKAGFFREVFEEIYYRKIQREHKSYLVKTLCVWETNLNLISNFFPRNDFSEVPQVKKTYQVSLLNDVGMAFQAIGQSNKAVRFYLRSAEILIKTPPTKGVIGHSDSEIKQGISEIYQNLADVQFRTGSITSAIESSKNALNFANMIADKRHISISKAHLAYMLFLVGKTQEASILFEEAKKLQPEGLYSLPGVRYADFLTYIANVDEAFKVSNKNIEICTQKKWVYNSYNCYRSLGTIERLRKNYAKSKEYLNDVLETNDRKIGISFLEIETLLARGLLGVDTKDYAGAATDAKHVIKLVDRTGFKLYEPDAEVVLAKVYLAQGDKDKAREYAQSAYDKAKQMSYYWPQKDAEEVLNSINNTN